MITNLYMSIFVSLTFFTLIQLLSAVGDLGNSSLLTNEAVGTIFIVSLFKQSSLVINEYKGSMTSNLLHVR